MPILDDWSKGLESLTRLGVGEFETVIQTRDAVEGLDEAM